MSKINIKPLADRVLVEPSEAETKTSSGIIIPDSAKEKPQKGKIVAVGPGTKENPVTLKTGDIVLSPSDTKLIPLTPISAQSSKKSKITFLLITFRSFSWNIA